MATVSGTVTDRSGNVATWSATWTVAAQATRVIGMSSPSDQWSTRLSEVGPPGVTARRIFADLTSTGRDQSTLIAAAVADGQIPWVSYKVPDPVAGGTGSYDAWATAAATYLNGLGVPVWVTVWHEPADNMTGPTFLALQRRLCPLFKKPDLKVGPILHTWVLDNQANWPDFDAYVADDLIADGTYDYFGFDSYQSGTQAAPGTKSLATRMSTILSRVAAHGGGSLPLGIGEFNAYEATTFTAVCNTVRDTDQIALACVFNSSTGSKGIVLTGSMLTTFQNLKANTKFVQ